MRYAPKNAHAVIKIWFLTTANEVVVVIEMNII